MTFDSIDTSFETFALSLSLLLPSYGCFSLHEKFELNAFSLKYSLKRLDNEEEEWYIIQALETGGERKKQTEIERREITSQIPNPK